MKLGISVASSYRVDDPREGARYMLERTRAARAAGFDSLFVGDHHATPQPYYQNVPMLGRMLAEWGDAMAGALFLLPLWNPVLVAEQVATLACLHPGRFVLQCGLGAGRGQFEAMGARIEHRPSAFEAAVDALRALWRGETVSTGPRFGNRNARISPLPPTPIDIWIGASAPPAIERAARMGDAWLGDPGMTLPVAAARIAQYRDACARHTRVPTTIPIRRDVYVGETLQSARRDMAPLIEGGYRGMDPEALVVGDIDSVTDTFARLGELGYDHVLVRNMTPVQSQALATIERLGEVRQRLATH